MTEDAGPKKSHLEDKLAVMGHLYDRFGSPGLKDHSLSDLTLFLTSKELELRDARKSNISEDQQEANRLLELQIRDLTGYVNSQLAGANLSTLQRFTRGYSQQQSPPTKTRDYGQER